MKEYRFYGWESADAKPINSAGADGRESTGAGVYPGIENARQLYDALSQLWCADTCAPRMRAQWTPDNKTLGQCSITAFLAQDIFGGKVCGIPLPDGNYHCYNVVGDCVFDLTSEQFGEEAKNLVYHSAPQQPGAPRQPGAPQQPANPEQHREVHFAKEEKRLRYEKLKAGLAQWCAGRS